MPFALGDMPLRHCQVGQQRGFVHDASIHGIRRPVKMPGFEFPQYRGGVAKSYPRHG
jgi:hypothetical protein